MTPGTPGVDQERVMKSGTRSSVAVAALLVAVGGSAALADTGGGGQSGSGGSGGSGPNVTVIVRGASAADAAASVQSAGGTVVATLPVIGGVSATVPVASLGSLANGTSVQTVTPDGALTTATPSAASVTAATQAVDPGTVTPAQAAASASADPASTGGLTGQGVGVALIDTGVTPVPGLSDPGQVIKAPDFSADPSGSGLDGYGHGTAMAGIIAGHDTGDGNGFTGVAPGARIINVRVGNNDGTVSVGQVIAAIGWVIAHRRDHGLNIRVLTLAYSINAPTNPNLDPLEFAVDMAWRSGIVVVAAAGNGGNGAPVSDPASDPNVIAVGASDNQNTASTADDTLAAFSSTGTSSARTPDLLAPGSRILSLRDPGSVLDTAFPDARRGSLYFRGSGTSESAAVVSGGVADLLQQRPDLTPDQVKLLLASAADTAPSTSIPVLDLAGALTTPAPRVPTSGELWGVGSPWPSYGRNYAAGYGYLLQQEMAAVGAPWSGSAWSGSAWSGSAWSGSAWSGSAWSGSAWSGSAWSGSAWSGSAWSGSAWSGSAWSGSAWSGSVWSGVIWR